MGCMRKSVPWGPSHERMPARDMGTRERRDGRWFVPYLPAGRDRAATRAGHGGTRAARLRPARDRAAAECHARKLSHACRDARPDAGRDRSAARHHQRSGRRDRGGGSPRTQVRAASGRREAGDRQAARRSDRGWGLAMTSHREALLYALLALAITVVLLILLTACETPLR